MGSLFVKKVMFMAMLWVGTTTSNLVQCPTPNGLTWGLQDISASDAGRTDDTKMHKNRIGQKRKLSLSWVTKNPATTAKILQMFNPEYVYVKYHDAMLNAYTVKRFYVGDRTAPVKQWIVGREYYESINFDIIER